jgi:hypothetical protein
MRSLIASACCLAVAFAEFGDSEGVPVALHDAAIAPLATTPPPSRQQKYLTYTMTSKFLGGGARQSLGDGSGAAGMRHIQHCLRGFLQNAELGYGECKDGLAWVLSKLQHLVSGGSTVRYRRQHVMPPPWILFYRKQCNVSATRRWSDYFDEKAWGTNTVEAAPAFTWGAAGEIVPTRNTLTVEYFDPGNVTGIRQSAADVAVVNFYNGHSGGLPNYFCNNSCDSYDDPDFGFSASKRILDAAHQLRERIGVGDGYAVLHVRRGDMLGSTARATRVERIVEVVRPLPERAVVLATNERDPGYIRKLTKALSPKRVWTEAELFHDVFHNADNCMRFQTLSALADEATDNVVTVSTKLGHRATRTLTRQPAVFPIVQVVICCVIAVFVVVVRCTAQHRVGKDSAESREDLDLSHGRATGQPTAASRD